MSGERVMAGLPDGRWVPSAPEPLWVGWGLRVAECECGRRFRARRFGVEWRRPWLGRRMSAAFRYRMHWMAEHAR